MIFAPGSVSAKAAQAATGTIPILSMSEDLITEGLASSLARPDRNTTGVSLISPDLDGKRGDLLLEAIPSLRHVAALADPSVDKPAHLQTLMDSAKARDIEISIFPAGTSQEILPALDAAKSSGAGAVNVLASQMFFLNRGPLIEHTRDLRLPAVYQWPDLAEQGGLMGIPIARILTRIGYSKWWTIVYFIPFVNIVGIWILAYSRWPAVDRTRT